jgi:hypothetical protein
LLFVDSPLFLESPPLVALLRLQLVLFLFVMLIEQGLLAQWVCWRRRRYERRTLFSRSLDSRPERNDIAAFDLIRLLRSCVDQAVTANLLPGFPFNLLHRDAAIDNSIIKDEYPGIPLQSRSSVTLRASS